MIPFMYIARAHKMRKGRGGYTANDTETRTQRKDRHAELGHKDRTAQHGVHVLCTPRAGRRREQKMADFRVEGDMFSSPDSPLA